MQLSIIIPVYNVESYIRKCLDSIYSQGIPTDIYEVIVVNDGTPDKSMTVVIEFAGKYSNLIIINQENQGLSGARNSGLKMARGEYVWFVDSDDWIERNSLKPLMDAIEVCCPELLCFDAIYHYKTTKKKIIQNLNQSGSYTGFDVMNIISHIGIWSILFNRHFLVQNNIIFTIGLIHEDEDFYIKTLAFSKQINYVPILGYNYMVEREGSIMNAVVSQNRVISRMRLIKLSNDLVRYNNFGNHNNILIMKNRWNTYFKQIYTLIPFLDLDDRKYVRTEFRKYKKELIYCAFHTKEFLSILQIPLIYLFPDLFLNSQIALRKIRKIFYSIIGK